MDMSKFFSTLCILYISIGVGQPVKIQKGGEAASYSSCPGNSNPVFVSLICKSVFSIIQNSSYVTISWTDITNVSNEIAVATINNNGDLQPGDAYRGVTMMRLGTGRLDGSIRLQMNASESAGSWTVFNCEVTALNDVPGVSTRGTVVVNTCPSKCVAKVGPYLAIAFSVLAILVAVLIVFVMLTGTGKKQHKVVKVAVIVVGAVLTLVAIILTAVYLSQEDGTCEFPQNDLNLTGAILCYTGFLFILFGLSWQYICPTLKKSETDAGKLKGTPETGKFKPAPPPKPKSVISKKDVSVEMKEKSPSYSQKSSPRKNSVEPIEDKPNLNTGPRKLPPLPAVGDNTPVKPMRKKSKKRKIKSENAE